LLDYIELIDWMYGGHERHGSKPLCESDLTKFFDSEGRLDHANEFRQAIYESGVEPSCRKVVWRYLLNIFPINLTSHERNEYLKDVSIKYEKYAIIYFSIVSLLIRLKKRWSDEQHHGEKIRTTMRMIHTDVLRTDRTFGFYASSGDNNENLKSLYHILITYSISHPNIPYCQGLERFY
jgi:hypothetical protein